MQNIDDFESGGYSPSRGRSRGKRFSFNYEVGGVMLMGLGGVVMALIWWFANASNTFTGLRIIAKVPTTETPAWFWVVQLAMTSIQIFAIPFINKDPVIRYTWYTSVFLDSLTSSAGVFSWLTEQYYFIWASHNGVFFYIGGLILTLVLCAMVGYSSALVPERILHSFGSKLFSTIKILLGKGGD